jgi:response regulator RpfG family c-di-GMP phosphodiesterase
MTVDERPRVLCVDDESNVLEGLTRTLRGLFSIETAVGGAPGLEAIKSRGPFAVVTSDFRMPGMSGVEFLAAARQLSPDTTRVLLTGYGDVNTAIGAVNEGNVFRFLTKPCPTDVLVKAIGAGAEQYRLVTSERILLEHTLHGSVKTLTDILALSNPAAFGRATRIRQSVTELMAHFQVAETWPVEVAAMLSQIGAVTLPPRTQEKLYQGELLTEAEQEMVSRVPRMTDQLLAHIPRLEPVREILHYYARRFAGDKHSHDNLIGESLPWGARALKIALDFDILQSEQGSNHAMDVLRSRIGCYDPVILEAFAELRGSSRGTVQVREAKLREMEVEMVFDEDVRSAKGVLLIARGQEVTSSLLERIRNFPTDLRIREPVRVLVPRRKE